MLAVAATFLGVWGGLMGIMLFAVLDIGLWIVAVGGAALGLLAARRVGWDPGAVAD